jgi:redox-regulated HSP33 family molecular chaperone
MLDYLVKAFSVKVSVAASVAKTTKLVEEARKRRHHTLPIAALGHLLTEGALFSVNLKNNQTLAIQITGDNLLQETEMLIGKISPELSLEIRECKRAQFSFRCSKKKLRGTLPILSQNELQNFIR